MLFFILFLPYFWGFKALLRVGSLRQRKEHCFTQAMSADENDQDDDLIAP